MNDLKGKVVLVTGASSGIGAAVALAFAAHGARVGVHCHTGTEAAGRVVAQIGATGGDAAMFQADVSKSAQCASLVDAAHRHFGRIDVLVNNAGGFVRRELLELADDELIEQVFNLNARSILACSRHVVPIMRSQGSGNIINVTSQAARSGGSSGSGLYSATKAYVSNCTRALAKELAAHHIRVNAVAPGVIDTPIHAYTNPATIAQLVAAIPMQRMGTAEECTGAFLFLASDQLASYVTGQVIEVNGGILMP